jgi:lysophospholipase L1-like esterase
MLLPLLMMTQQLPADQPLPRTDVNSKLAHSQLVHKAKQGRIDVYFVGDSITRRWGCTDPMYRPLLNHWRKSLFGWNAANFGWGGDTTQNILWRLNNGELDGPTPKVFVILAGTNNLANGLTDDEAQENVARGVKAIVETCLRRSPSATAILMGVLPRDDIPGAQAAIAGINRRLQSYGGSRVRYLDIGPSLLSPDGKLRPEVSSDGLHLLLPGYEVWADALRPVLHELLGPPAEHDYAPPPTGDPSVVGGH